ncbi:MAG: hypothetical protein WCT24_02980 [Patescibacteria group bacterium]
MNHLDELKALNLPAGQYAIFGSGPMAIRGMRESHDIDLIVKKGIYDALVAKHPESIRENPSRLVIGNIEVFKDWRTLTSQMDEMIDTAETIEGFPFVKLEYVVQWKKEMGREKDLKDLELIRTFQRV